MDQAGIHIDPERGEPIYRQIYQQIVERIRAGHYPAGHRLPPTRELARELSTNRNTVVRAFDELEASGLVHSEVGRGTFVSEQPRTVRPVEAAGRPELPWNSLVSRVADAEPLGRLDRFVRWLHAGDLINLAGMYPSAELLPADPLRHCIDHVLREHGASILGYAPRQGVPRLRAQVAERLRQEQIMVTQDDVVITTGSQQALDLIARALIDPGDTLFVDEYTYPGALNAFATAGGRIIGVASDDQGPNMSALRRLARDGAKGFYLMPDCVNPTGASISAARRKELINWSHEAAIPLIEDDYGADLDLNGGPRPIALRAMDPEVLYVGTFSKRLIPALRVGYLICPPALRQRIIALKHGLDLGTSALLQHALAEFIARGYLRTHLRRTLPAYRARRDALLTALRQHLPPEVRWEKPSRGLFVWLELPTGDDPELVFEEAQRQGVLISPGTLHSVHVPAKCGLRLTFCAEPPDRLVEGARRLGVALKAILDRRRGAMTLPTPPAIDGV
ncbi:MAG: PLP-dependent aminotransferase family protein [Planctomycetota bacterium]